MNKDIQVSGRIIKKNTGRQITEIENECAFSGLSVDSLSTKVATGAA